VQFLPRVLGNKVIVMESTTYKTCIKCHKELPTTSFNKRGGEKYLRTECKKCNNSLTKIRKELRTKYGSPPDDYICPICGRTENECRGEGSKIASSWVVDHCHKTDVFRGWLCHRCNRGIGAFGDDAEMLQKAINYLKKGNKRSLMSKIINYWR
tara:strand:+ start:258 stop:719 length:462 start_codon:yes stop_codon:yes gene_type:complete